MTRSVVEAHHGGAVSWVVRIRSATGNVHYEAHDADCGNAGGWTCEETIRPNMRCGIRRSWECEDVTMRINASEIC